jgi:nucleoside phosphorylase
MSTRAWVFGPRGNFEAAQELLDRTCLFRHADRVTNEGKTPAMLPYADSYAPEVVVSESALRGWQPTALIFPSGLFTPVVNGPTYQMRWRVPYEVIRRFVEHGGLVLAANLGSDAEVSRHDNPNLDEQFAGLFGARQRVFDGSPSVQRVDWADVVVQEEWKSVLPPLVGSGHLVRFCSANEPLCALQQPHIHSDLWATGRSNAPVVVGQRLGSGHCIGWITADVALTDVLSNLHAQPGILNSLEIGNSEPLSPLAGMRILFVTATEDEGRGLTKVLESRCGTGRTPVPTGRFTYVDYGVVSGVRVFHVRTRMGVHGASMLQEVVGRTATDVMVMVGGCASLAPGVQVRDVVVSTRMHDRTLGKADGDDATDLTITAHPKMRSYREPSAPVIEALRRSIAEGQEDQIHFGETMAVPYVVKSRFLRDIYKASAPQAIALDMEGAGLALSGFDLQSQWAWVKGVTDEAEKGKNDDHKEEALARAARVAVQLLKPSSLDRAGLARNH